MTVRQTPTRVAEIEKMWMVISTTINSLDGSWELTVMNLSSVNCDDAFENQTPP
jgi:hypothetical protein